MSHFMVRRAWASFARLDKLKLIPQTAYDPVRSLSADALNPVGTRDTRPTLSIYNLAIEKEFDEI